MLTKPDWKSMNATERIEAITRLAKDDLSAAEIALRFKGCTRHSVIGYCYRYGITLQGGMIRSPHRGSAKKKKYVKLPSQQQYSPPLDASKAVPFIVAIEQGLCKWPLWGADKSIGDCCGLPRAGDGPYCEEHTQKSIGLGTPSERAALETLEKMS